MIGNIIIGIVGYGMALTLTWVGVYGFLFFKRHKQEDQATVIFLSPLFLVAAMCAAFITKLMIGV